MYNLHFKKDSKSVSIYLNFYDLMIWSILLKGLMAMMSYVVWEEKNERRLKRRDVLKFLRSDK